MPRYATCDPQGNIRWLVDLPFERDDAAHIPVPEGHPVGDDPALWRVVGGTLASRPQAEIDAILAVRNQGTPQDRLLAWARTRGFMG